MLNNIVGVLDIGTPVSTTSYESIQTFTVGSGGSSAIDFTSIPSTYKHLQIRIHARSSQTSTGGSYLGVRFNSDSGNNYSYHALQGDGSSATAGALASQNYVYLQRMANDNNSASIYGDLIVDLLDYTNTNKYTTVRSLGGYDANGTGRIYLTSSVWMNTNAISSISITPENGNFNQYSSFALYGIKG